VATAKKIGRPSLFTQELADSICTRLAEGESLRAILRDDGMPAMSVVFRWLSQNLSFQEQYTRAREAQADHEFDGLCSMADEPPEKKQDGTVDNGWVQHQKLRIDTRKWAISKLAPKKYGDKLTTELTGKDGGPIQTEEMSPNDLARRIAFALANGLKKPD
jgi:hypothetical protein